MKNISTIDLPNLEAKSVEIEIGYKDNDITIINDIGEIPHFIDMKTDINTILACHKGKIQCVVNGKKILAHENQIVMTQSRAIISDIMVSPDFQCNIICLTDRMIKNQLHNYINIWNQALYVNHMNILQLPDNVPGEEERQQMSELLVYYMKRPRNYFHKEIIASMVRCLLLEICALIQEQLPQQSLPPTQGDHLFNRFLQMLADSDVKRNTVGFYANQLCVSPKYLSSVCRQNSGKTALHWINEYTLNDISYYLRNSSLTIKEVSNRLGFPNLSFFGKFVRQHFGVSPREYRNKATNK